ncbi:metallophosphoesterase [Stenotrophomonas sp. SPM]|uniref:metallophosphoesterase n=1 Tax=Stenotrophomonas sp. SPM TaxID=2170735 RepID=UPI001A9C7096|nr:metallophosphoesterase [Stenotrophomonas sp. SPM]
MRILVLSDLHRELWSASDASRRHFLEHSQPDLATCKPDAVVLAGDIDTGDRAVQWAAKSFSGTPVIYVAGNHEGYGHSIDRVEGKIRDACSKNPGVHFLNGNQVVIDDVRFLGATLWTDMMLHGRDHYPDVFRAAGQQMNDYKRIRIGSAGFRKLRPADTCLWHAQQRSWIEQRLAEPFEGKTVVVTHMAPSAKSIPTTTSKNYCLPHTRPT